MIMIIMQLVLLAAVQEGEQGLKKNTISDISSGTFVS